MQCTHFVFMATVTLVVQTAFAGSSDTTCPETSVTVTIPIPSDCPTGMTILASGRFTPSGRKETAWELVRSDVLQDHRLGQRDTTSGRVLCFVDVGECTPSNGQLCLIAKPIHSRTNVTIAEKAEGYQFLDGGRKVLFYQKVAHSLDGGTHISANYIHPLFGLEGDVLTQDFPRDHRHHHGIFWAWHQLWVGETRAGDPWADKDFLPVVRKAEVIEQGPLFATLRVAVDWTSPRVTDDEGLPLSIVNEETTIRLYHATDTFQYMDFTIVLTAQLDDVKIGGAENIKGYSGFTVRMKPPKGITIVNESGQLTEDAVGAISRWADVSGIYGNRETVSGIGILTHRELPEFPPHWLLRHYGAQNVIYPGRYAVPLPKDQPLVLRYRLVLHRGDVHESRIADHQRIYECLRTNGK